MAYYQESVIAYTDGACTGNPGPGGWGAIIIEGGRERPISGSEAWTTNQRMELRAALEVLRAVAATQRVLVYSDSAYLVNCFREKWYERWRRNGWLNSQRKPVENRDLWEDLISLAEKRNVAWHKVAGHSGDPLNDRADGLARAAAIHQLTQRSRGSKPPVSR